MTDRFVPLSVEYGNRRVKLGWWFKGRCEAVALWLAPWLTCRSILYPQPRPGRHPDALDHAALDEFLESHRRVEQGGFTVVALDGCATVTLNDGFLLLQVSDYRAEESAALVLTDEQAGRLGVALQYERT